jgi:hypothetical protein
LTSRRAVFVEAPLRGYPKPRCRALSVVAPCRTPVRRTEGYPSTRRCAARRRRAEPCVLEFRPSSRVFLPLVDVRVCPGRPHPSASRPRPRRGVAQRVSPRRRVVRCDWIFWKPAIARVGNLLQVWACGSPESSAPQRLGPGSPRRRAGAVAVASPYPGAARYASRHRSRGPAYGSRLAVQLKGLETTRSLAPQRIEGSPPAVRESRRCKNASRTWTPGTSQFFHFGCKQNYLA